MTIILDMPEAEYHAHPALSSTGARLLLESPAKFQYGLTHKRPDKPEFDLGSAFHAKVLGTGYQVVTPPDHMLASNGAWSTTAAKDFIADARAKGQIPMKKETIAERDAMVEAVLAHPSARAFLEQEGDAEASVFATDPDTEVRVRCRFDKLAKICVDLKTARDASPSGFSKAAGNYGYDVQDAFYLDALYYQTGERRDMVFIAIEVEPPYLVGVYQLDYLFADMGSVKAKKARELFAEYTASGIWPGYSPKVELLPPPVFATYEFQEKYA